MILMIIIVIMLVVCASQCGGSCGFCGRAAADDTGLCRIRPSSILCRYVCPTGPDWIIIRDAPVYVSHPWTCHAYSMIHVFVWIGCGQDPAPWHYGDHKSESESSPLLLFQGCFPKGSLLACVWSLLFLASATSGFRACSMSILGCFLQGSG